jgi:hypothetical protein
LFLKCLWGGEALPCDSPPPGEKVQHISTVQLDRAGELAADGAERVPDDGGKARHGSYGAETDQAGYECVFDQVLTGFIVHQGGNYVLEVLHGVSPGFEFELGG